VFVSFYWLT